MSTPEEKTPAENVPRAISPDDLLPPQVPHSPPGIPLAIPVAQPLPVAQLQPFVQQPIWPQPIAQPVPVAPVPVAPVPVAPVPVAPQVAPQVPAAVDAQPLASPAIPVAQPLTPQPAPAPFTPAAPVARAIPLAPPTAPNLSPVVVPKGDTNSSPPPTKQPAPKRPAARQDKRPAPRKPQQKNSTPQAVPKDRTTQQRSGSARHEREQAERSTTRETTTREKPLDPQTNKSLPKAAGTSRAKQEAPPPPPIVTDPDPADGATVNSLTGGMPSWLVSSILHVLVVVLLSLLTLPTFSDDDAVFIELAYAEQEDLAGEELLDLPTLDMPVAEPVVLQQLPEVSDPLAAMPILDPNFLGEVAPTDVQALAIGMALTGREKGMRNALVGKYGGTKATESSVEGGLAWLARNQQRDGTWSLQGPYPDGSPVENQAAATAMALLAFQGAGNTHLAGDYQEQVAHGWKALLKLQKENGDFYHGDVPNQQLYTHGQATIAVCELYGMTKDKAFRDPATRAVAFALQAQSPEGGWRYYPGQGADTSVTGWYVMALQSALMAGIEVPEENLQRITKYLDSVQLEGGSQYVYQPLQPATPTMTAEGLLCRQYLGWEREDARLLSGVEYVLSHPVNPAENHDVYYWYYAAQLTHHMEGEAWDRWNETMRVALPKLQVTSGKERGSWEPKPDRWSHLGGRLYTTCFSVYSLEVYYRHLPIYTYREQ